jgi:hypothetical protein
MKVKFKSDFRGKETGEQYFRAGEIADFDDKTAARLVTDGRAEFEKGGIDEQPAEVTNEKSIRKSNHGRRR